MDVKKIKGVSSRVLRKEFERYIETQDLHYAKNTMYRPRP